MAEYKDIHGTPVRNSAGDLPGAKTGELFYDSTNLDFKYKFPNVTSTGAWRTANSMNEGRVQLSGAGIQTAAVGFGGLDTSNNNSALTELYDGTSWTEVNDMNTARRDGAGNGTQTSALTYAGKDANLKTETESWNGTNWTAGNDLSTARSSVAGAGADSTSALAFGGESTDAHAETETWNGTNWTEVNDMNTG